MRRLPLIAALIGLVLVATSLAISRRKGKIEAVSERDGSRTVRPHAVGPFLTVHEECDLSLHVSDDLAEELKRLGLKLPFGTARFLSDADRFYADHPTMTYGLRGETAAISKEIVEAFVRQLPHPVRQFGRSYESGGGVCADGRSRIHVVAERKGTETSFVLYLTVRH